MVDGCGQAKNGLRHSKYGDHPYAAPPKERKKPKRMGLSKKPKRVERRQAGSDEAKEHHARVKYCEAKSYGITTPCGQGPDATPEHSHIIGKGMGGGKDYAVSDGACAILCRKHHRDLDLDRATYRAAGLSRHAPPHEEARRSGPLH